MSMTITAHALLEDAIHLTWSDGHESLFHHVWLRDNCPGDRHPTTWERLDDVLAFDAEIAPARLSVSPTGDVSITWNDDHDSVYPTDWLRRHCYSDAARRQRRRTPVTWAGGAGAEPPGVDHRDIMETDAGLLGFLETLRDRGCCVVSAMPDDREAGELLAKRIAYLRETNFGVDFTVVSKPNPNNNAYTALELPAHTDLANREMPPGVQFLHCLVSEAPGGESILVDGFHAAEILRARNREAFDILSSVPVDYRFHDTEWDVRWRAPIIGLDADGEIGEIRYNNALRGPLDVAPDLVKPTYGALRAFAAILRDPGNEVRFRLDAGEMLVFHNRRVLHGRAAFDPNGGARELHGCYVDIDEMMSRIRVLGGDNLLA